MTKKLIVVADAENAIFYFGRGLKIDGEHSRITADDFYIALHNNPKRQGFYHIGSTPSHFFDPHSEAKSINRAEFTKHIISHLQSVISKNNFEELLIVSTPKVLGEIRKHLPYALKHLVTKEIPKELKDANIEEVAKQIFSK